MNIGYGRDLVEIRRSKDGGIDIKTVSTQLASNGEFYNRYTNKHYNSKK